MIRHVRIRPLLVAVVAGASSLAACGQLLGIPGETELGSEAGAPSDEAGSPIGTDGSTSSDGSVTGEAGPCTGADLKTDEKHCGRCDHDCLGGECLESTCQPVALAQDLGRPIALAVDDKYVFWTDRTEMAVKRVGKDGQGLAPVATGIDDLQGVAADGEFVYWGIEDFTPTGGVYRKGRTAEVASPAQQLAQADHVWDVELFKGRLYFTAWNEGTIRATDPDGGAPKLIVESITQVRHVAVDDLFAYYTSYQSNVYRVPLDGGAELAIGPEDYGSGIATDGVFVAWGSAHPNGTAELNVWNETVNNGVALELTSGPVPPMPNPVVRDAVTVAFDKDRIYFTFFGAADGGADGFLGWCPRTGCKPSGPELIAKALMQPTAMVLDDSAIYYSTFDVVGSARIWKVAKP